MGVDRGFVNGAVVVQEAMYAGVSMDHGRIQVGVQHFVFQLIHAFFLKRPESVPAFFHEKVQELVHVHARHMRRLIGPDLLTDMFLCLELYLLNQHRGRRTRYRTRRHFLQTCLMVT